MTLTPVGIIKRASAGLMLALALVYLLHAACHSGIGAVPCHPSGAAVALEQDLFAQAETLCGKGAPGCHFFCSHGCPVPPLPQGAHLPEALIANTYPATKTTSAHGLQPQPIETPPRPLV